MIMPDASSRYQRTSAAGEQRNAGGVPAEGPVSHAVLIVDDAEFMRAMLREIVQDLGWSVAAEAGDGADAIELSARLRPDLVLLDITMPTMDGNEALAAILARDPQAKVVMITALGQKDQVLAAIKLGARDFIIKPFDTERVAATLTRLLSATEPVDAV
jgi:two-component system chemotaxis response regulator CheY